MRLKGGLPTIAVRDLAIQRRETDLVVGTFGRGIYVLDDYSPLRALTPEALAREAMLLPVKDPAVYVPALPLGLRGASFQGGAYYLAPNPPYGAVFTYALKDEIKTRKKTRQEREKELAEKGADAAYPSWEELRAEEREEEPAIVLTIRDAEGAVVRRLSGPATAGVSRVAWDLRYPPPHPTSLEAPKDDNPFVDPPRGPLVVPGAFTVELAKRVDGVTTPLAEPRRFTAQAVGTPSLPVADRGELLAFQRRVASLQRAALGAAAAAEETATRLQHLRKAIVDTPAAEPRLETDARALEDRLRAIRVALEGDDVVRARREPTLPGIVERVDSIVQAQWTSTSATTQTSRDAYTIAGEAFAVELGKLRALHDELRRLEETLEAAGAPWTPGRVPTWTPE